MLVEDPRNEVALVQRTLVKHFALVQRTLVKHFALVQLDPREVFLEEIRPKGIRDSAHSSIFNGIVSCFYKKLSVSQSKDAVRELLLFLHFDLTKNAFIIRAKNISPPIFAQ